MRILRYRAIAVAVLAVSVALVQAGTVGAQTAGPVCDPPPPPIPQPVKANELASGEKLEKGESIASPNGYAKLEFEEGGNLVFRVAGKALWKSGTPNTDGEQVKMQKNGNLVMSRVSTPIQAIFWHSDTAGSPGAVLRVQNDGRAVIRAVKFNKAGKRIGLGAELWWINPDPPPEQPVPATEIAAPSVLVPGSYVDSPDGKQRLSFQEDSNLVLYRGGKAKWQSRTVGKGDVVQLQNDGNLVMRRGGTLAPVWHSGTAGSPRAVLRVQNDGRVVIRAVKFNKAGKRIGLGAELWSIGSVPPPPPPPPPVVRYNALMAGEALHPGQSISSPDGCQVLTLEHDGNLVLHRNGKNRKALWNSGTSYVRAQDALARSETAAMQSDGNFVLYQYLPGRPTPLAVIWHSRTHGSKGAYLAVQDDGRAVIRSAKGAELWSAGLARGTDLWSLGLPVGDARIKYKEAAP